MEIASWPNLCHPYSSILELWKAIRSTFSKQPSFSGARYHSPTRVMMMAFDAKVNIDFLFVDRLALCVAQNYTALVFTASGALNLGR